MKADNITKSIRTLEERKDDLDEDDVASLVKIVTSFHWDNSIQMTVKSHLELIEGIKKHPGTGRGNTNEKMRMKKLEESLEVIEKNEEFLSEKMKTKLQSLKSSNLKKNNSTKETMTDVEDKQVAAKRLGRLESAEIKRSLEKYQVKTLEDLSSVNLDSYYKETNMVLHHFIEGLVEGENKHGRINVKEKPYWKITVVEISDRIKRLMSQVFLSPIGLSRNYFILKTTGSRLAVDILGSTDGSGKYDTLRKVEEQSANQKSVTVLPMDIRLTADNEQVLKGNYRICGTEQQRRLHVNVINNWMVSYVETEATKGTE